VAHILGVALVVVRYRLGLVLLAVNQLLQQEMDTLVQAIFLIQVRQVGVVAEAQIQLTQEQEMRGAVHFKEAPVVVVED
jgi:hypothetical protein